MIQSVSFGDYEYNIMLAALLFGRGMDILSTWVATPNLMLEANPIARRLGWKWGVLFNLALCFSVACFPLPAVVVVTTSLLVAARNFKTAWLMRAMGEERYMVFMLNQVHSSNRWLYVLCLLAEGFLVAIVGVAVAYYSFVANGKPSIPLGVGGGIVAYAVAVVFYSCLSLWRSR
jgi:hypothetical protein